MIEDNKFNEFNFYLNNIVSEKENLDNYIKDVDDLKKDIRKIRWNDLQLEKIENYENLRVFIISLPDDLQKRLDNFLIDERDFMFSETLIEYIFMDNTSSFKGCRFQIDSFTNRIDIPGNGLPRGFRKLGLGPKMYRKIVEEIGYISSEEYQLSEFGKLLWNNLRKNNLFYTFVNERRGFAFPSSEKAETILSILDEKFNFNYSEALLDDDFEIKHTDLIIKTQMAKYLRPKN